MCTTKIGNTFANKIKRISKPVINYSLFFFFLSHLKSGLLATTVYYVSSLVGVFSFVVVFSVDSSVKFIPLFY